MTAHVIDGKAFAAGVRARVKDAATHLKSRHGLAVGLTVVLVGNDPASEIYVRHKVNDAREVGIVSRDIKLPAETSEAAVLKVVRELNDDPAVHGVLVQFPVPAQIRQEAVLDTLSPDKDVDGLTILSAGRLMSGRAGLVSCPLRSPPLGDGRASLTTSGLPISGFPLQADMARSMSPSATCTNPNPRASPENLSRIRVTESTVIPACVNSFCTSSSVA